MSRLIDGFDGRPAAVDVDAANRPIAVDGLPILRRLARSREWIGILDGEPQRDIWLVETPEGLLELHYLCHPYPPEEEGDEASSPGTWLLARRAD